MTSFLAKIADVFGRIPRVLKMLVGLLVVVLVGALAVPLLFVPQSTFLGRIEEYADNHKSLGSSLHAGLSCSDCHYDDRGPIVHAVALTGEFYRTVLSGAEEPAFIEMPSPASDACRRCHGYGWSDNAERTTLIPHPAHLRVSTETRECVQCHKWTAHLEEYLEEHKTMPFSGVCAQYECHAGWKSADECTDCHHELLEDPAKWRQLHPDTVMAVGDNGCLELCHEVKQCQQCHTTGKTPFTGGPTRTERSELQDLHGKADWMQTHGAWALVDQTVCLSCHVSLGQCNNCHSHRPASHGSDETWISAHKDSVKSDKQCVTCHDQEWCEDCHRQFKEMR